MDIGPVNNAKPSPERGEVKRKRAAPEEDRNREKKDELALSEKARDLQRESDNSDGVNRERLREIRERIDRGYYQRPKVTKKVVEKILGEESVEVDFLRAKYPAFFEGIPDGGSDETDVNDKDEEE